MNIKSWCSHSESCYTAFSDRVSRMPSRAAMDFLRRVGDVVGDAFVSSDSESDAEPPDADERAKDFGASDATASGSRDSTRDGAAAKELDELMSTALSFGRSTLERLKDVSKGVGKELTEGLRDIKEQVREDLAQLAESEIEGSIEGDEEDKNDIDREAAKYLEKERLGREYVTGVIYTGDGVMITGDDGDDEAFEVSDELERVGEKIELLGQRMFFGAGKILKELKETTRDAIKETREAFSKDAVKPKRVRDEFSYRVQAIQRDSGTYCNEPKKELLYKYFLGDFSIVSYGQDISTTLSSNNFMKELFTRIVPTVVDEETFWSRYFFKVYELEIEFGRRDLPDSLSEAAHIGDSGKEANLHTRIASLATDEEGFDSDSSIAKEDWTKIKQTSAKASPDKVPGPAPEGETASTDASDDDEDWGLK